MDKMHFGLILYILTSEDNSSLWTKCTLVQFSIYSHQRTTHIYGQNYLRFNSLYTHIRGQLIFMDKMTFGLILYILASEDNSYLWTK